MRVHCAAALRKLRDMGGLSRNFIHRVLAGPLRPPRSVKMHGGTVLLVAILTSILTFVAIFVLPAPLLLRRALALRNTTFFRA